LKLGLSRWQLSREGERNTLNYKTGHMVAPEAMLVAVFGASLVKLPHIEEEKGKIAHE